MYKYTHSIMQDFIIYGHISKYLLNFDVQPQFSMDLASDF